MKKKIFFSSTPAPSFNEKDLEKMVLENLHLEDLSSDASVEEEEGKIFLYGEISQDSMLEFNRILHRLHKQRQLLQVQHCLQERPPIHVHIHSYGGEVYAGLAAVDTICQLDTPIHTHIEGSAASSATLISAVGDHRTIGRNSYVLIHQISSGFWGKFEEMKDSMQNAENMMRHLVHFYERYTKIPKRKLTEMMKKDIYWNAKEALQYGIVDEIL